MHYKARLVICENGKESFQEDTFSPVTYHFVIRLIFSLSVRKRWASKHIDFEIAFPNGIIERSVYDVILVHVFPDVQRKGSVLKFRSSFYGLKAAVRIWSKVLFKTLKE